MSQQAYLKVFNVLRQQILAGDMVPGQKMPPERSLCQQFGVSRITVRHATRLLQEQGLIDRFRGRGTFVRSARTRKIPISGGDFVGSIRAAAPDFRREVVSCKHETPPEHIADSFGLLKGQRCLTAERVDYDGDQPFACDYVYVPDELSGSLDSEMLSRLDFLSTWTAAENITHGHHVESFEAIEASATLAGRLAMPKGMPVLIACEQLYSSDGTIIAAFESFYRGDRVRLVSTTMGKSDVTNKD